MEVAAGAAAVAAGVVAVILVVVVVVVVVAVGVVATAAGGACGTGMDSPTPSGYQARQHLHQFVCVVNRQCMKNVGRGQTYRVFT